MPPRVANPSRSASVSVGVPAQRFDHVAETGAAPSSRCTRSGSRARPARGARSARRPACRSRCGCSARSRSSREVVLTEHRDHELALVLRDHRRPATSRTWPCCRACPPSSRSRPGAPRPLQSVAATSAKPANAMATGAPAAARHAEAVKAAASARIGTSLLPGWTTRAMTEAERVRSLGRAPASLSRAAGIVSHRASRTAAGRPGSRREDAAPRRCRGAASRMPANAGGVSRSRSSPSPCTQLLARAAGARAALLQRRERLRAALDGAEDRVLAVEPRASART